MSTKHPNDIVPHYRQIAPMSCVPWGVEVLLLTFQKEITPNFLQKQYPNGCGYDVLIKPLRDQFGLETREESFGNNFGAFERAIMTELEEGRYPIFNFPQCVMYIPELREIRFVNHTFIAIKENGFPVFLTQSGAGILRFAKQDMADRHHAWHPYLTREKQLDVLLHTLFAQPL